MDKVFDIFDQYATDPKLELEGKWIAIGPATKTLTDGSPDPASAPQLLVARSGNRRHGRIVSALYEANKTTLEMKNDIADDKGEEITIESMAKGVLLGWKNIGFKRKAVPDSDALTPAERLTQAKALLAVKDFREMVNKKATDFNEYKLVQEAADAKNSQSTSGGD